MQPNDLERLVGAALVRLPEPRAPHTLLPRVLAAVRDTRLRWYARGWRAWPPAWRLASSVVCGAVVVAGLAVAPAAQAVFADGWTTLEAGMPDALTRPVARAAAAAALFDAARDVVGAVWRLLLVRVVAGAAVLVVLMCLTGAALGTAVRHVALPRVLST